MVEPMTCYRSMEPRSVSSHGAFFQLSAIQSFLGWGSLIKQQGSGRPTAILDCGVRLGFYFASSQFSPTEISADRGTVVFTAFSISLRRISDA